MKAFKLWLDAARLLVLIWFHQISRYGCAHIALVRDWVIYILTHSCHIYTLLRMEESNNRRLGNERPSCSCMLSHFFHHIILWLAECHFSTEQLSLSFWHSRIRKRRNCVGGKKAQYEIIMVSLTVNACFISFNKKSEALLILIHFVLHTIAHMQTYNMSLLDNNKGKYLRTDFVFFPTLFLLIYCMCLQRRLDKKLWEKERKRECVFVCVCVRERERKGLDCIIRHQKPDTD